MHYLITGGAGFIGSHLCDALLAAGHSLSIIDDLSSGNREHVPSGAELIVADCGDVARLAPLVVRADGVFHLAAIASVPRSLEQWRETSMVNQMATIAIFEAIRHRAGGVVPCVYASSAAVYGDPDCAFLPLDEHTPTQPLTPYGADKLGCESHAAVARHVFAIPTLGLRFFNVYGPRQDPSSPYSGVISIFACKLAAAEPLTIYGDGLQSRDFIHVSDVVAHLDAAMQYLHQAQCLKRESVPVALNVCSGTETTLLELAGLLGMAYGISPQIEHAPARSGDIRRSLGNPGLASSHLGIHAQVELADGLTQLIAAFKQ